MRLAIPQPNAGPKQIFVRTLLVLGFLCLAWFTLSSWSANAASAGDETSPIRGTGHLAIYYGWPSQVNGAHGNSNLAVNTFSQFDIVVFGDGLQHSSHFDHSRSQYIVRRLVEQGVEVYGYIDMGVSTQNLPLVTAQQYVDEWLAMGVTGIFWDDAGYDFGVSRDRRLALIDYTHAQGLRVFINAWTPSHVLAGDTHLGPDDIFLSECRLVCTDSSLASWAADTEALLSYRDRIGIRIATIDTGELQGQTNSPTDPYQVVWWGAAMHDLDAAGYTDKLYSASGQNANQLLPPPPFKGAYGTEFTSEIVQTQNGAVFIRDTNMGRIVVAESGNTLQGYFKAHQGTITPTPLPTSTPSPAPTFTPTATSTPSPAPTATDTPPLNITTCPPRLVTSVDVGIHPISVAGSVAGVVLARDDDATLLHVDQNGQILQEISTSGWGVNGITSADGLAYVVHARATPQAW